MNISAFKKHLISVLFTRVYDTLVFREIDMKSFVYFNCLKHFFFSLFPCFSFFFCCFPDKCSWLAVFDFLFDCN